MKAATVTHLDRLNAANQVKYRVSADWVQLHVKNDADFGEKNTVRYKIKRSGQTKIFKDVYSITDVYGKNICAYATNANECILSRGHGILKFDNSQLYLQLHLAAFVQQFLDECGFKFVGITRLDIAFDFHKFHNNRDPHCFIQSFFRGDILKLMRSQFRAAGVHNERNQFNWLYFGSHNSEVSYKLYDKTGEQEAKGKKPWIWQDWQLNSLLDTDQRVWRLEFTVNSSTAVFANRFTECAFHSLDLLRRENFTSLFVGLFEHYFRFVKKDLSKGRKDRMPAVKLIDFDAALPEAFDIKRALNPERAESSRTQKIFINQLLKHQQELREYDSDFDADAMAMIEKVIDKYNLQDWAKKKGIPVASNTFIYPLPNNNYKDYTGDIASFKNLNDE